MLVEFRGARMETDDEGEKVFVDRGPIWIETTAAIGVYEHTIVTERRNFFVMEPVAEIVEKLEAGKREKDAEAGKREKDAEAGKREKDAEAAQADPEEKDDAGRELLEEIRMG